MASAPPAALLAVLAFTVLLLVLPITPAAAADGSASPGAVWVTEVKGIVDPAMAG